MRIVTAAKPPDAAAHQIKEQLEQVERFIKARERVQWGSRYTRFYKYLYEVFAGKCAYCEAVVPTLSKLRIDHYRPKGAVVDDRRKAVVDGTTRHPGYYWLAYAWGNLVPACEACNTAKGAQFPIEGPRAFNYDDDLDREKPLLISPLADTASPVVVEDELEFHKNGRVRGLTKRGRETVRVCALNRADLVRDRAEHSENVIGWTADMLKAMGEGRRTTIHDQKLRDACSGAGRYSAAANAMFRLIRKRVEGWYEQLRSPEDPPDPSH